jgi:formate dehydrogenase major subunit
MMIHPRLFDRFSGSRKDYDRQVRTVCRECSLRCGIIAYLRNGRMIDLHGDDDHPVNRGRLCAQGLAFVQGIVSPYRLTRPAFRSSLEDPFTAVEDWGKALDWLAENLRKIKDRYGAESLVILSDPEADLEFAIGASRFAGLLGTPHLYHPWNAPSSPTGLMLSNPAPPCYEWGKSRSLFLIGADIAATHPVAFGWVLEARQRGAKIIAADVRFTRTLARADLPLSIRAGSENALGLALMKLVREDPGQHGGLALEGLKNPDQWLEALDRLSWPELKKVLGLSDKTLKELQSLLRENHPAVFVTGRNLTELEGYGVWPALATIESGTEKKGGGWYPLDLTTPPLNPRQGLAGPPPAGIEEKEGFQAAGTWKELRKQIEAGAMRPRAVLCPEDGLEDLLWAFQDQEKIPDLIATFGCFPGFARERSHAFFPGSLWAETSGLCFSNDRSVHWGEKILEPLAGCRSGLAFWAGMAKRFGGQEAFPWLREEGTTDQDSFCRWVLESSPALRGLSLNLLKDPDRISSSPLFWSFGPEGVKDPDIDPKPAVRAVASLASTRDGGPFPFHFQQTPLVTRSGSAGRFWPSTQDLEEDDAVQIHPQTALALEIENGNAVVVASPAGNLAGRAWITRMVPPWMVASPKNLGQDRVLVHKKDQTPEEALSLLKERLS